MLKIICDRCGKEIQSNDPVYLEIRWLLPRQLDDPEPATDHLCHKCAKFYEEKVLKQK